MAKEGPQIYIASSQITINLNEPLNVALQKVMIDERLIPLRAGGLYAAVKSRMPGIVKDEALKPLERGEARFLWTPEPALDDGVTPTGMVVGITPSGEVELFRSVPAGAPHTIRRDSDVPVSSDIYLVGRRNDQGLFVSERVLYIAREGQIQREGLLYPRRDTPNN